MGSLTDVLCISSSIKMPLLVLPTKTILVRLAHGVVMISPGSGLAGVREQIDAFGTVTDIVAPNLFHNVGIKSACKLFPDATLWGVKGFAEKLPGISWEKTLEPEWWPYGAELELMPVNGMPKINEMVMLHRASRTLIATDLCFNHVEGRGFGYWVVFNLFGAYRKFAVSRLFLKMAKDKAALNESLKQILAADFDNVIMAHGHNVLGNGKAQLKQALIERGVAIQVVNS